MPAFYPVASTGISDQLFQSRLLSQFAFDRSELLRLQDQLSTGLRVSVASDDARASLRAVTLQRLLEQRDQTATNVATSQSYLAATDSALNGVADVLLDVRAEALTVVDTTTNESQREAIAQLADEAVTHLVDVSNRSFRGRQLFAGSGTDLPFRLAGPHVQYRGNEAELSSLIGNGLAVTTNANGHEVFGALSAQVRGVADLDPVLTLDSKLSDLRGGLGITKGSFLISDGTTTETVDISTAETIRDVVRAIESSAPDGRTFTVEVTPRGLIVDIDDAGGGNLAITELRPGGTVAAELGLLNKQGVGIGQIVGSDLNPRLLPTTRLADVLGSRAQAVLQSGGAFNDIFIEASQNGVEFDDVQVAFVANTAAGDQAFASYNPTLKTLELDVNPGTTTAATVVDAINGTGVFTATLDTKFDADNDGSGEVDFTATATLANGSGTNLDQRSGIQIVNGGATHTISFEEIETVEELLNLVTISPANVVASINAAGTGIDIRSRLSGSNFHIGENGGATASDLGIRTFSRDTLLAELNHGRGVDLTGGNDPAVLNNSSPGSHVDFVIERKDGVSLDIDLTSALTVGDAIDLINNHADNTGNAVVARLAQYGNGIELYDANVAAAGTLTVTRAESFAAADLGFMELSSESASASSATAATVDVAFNQPNDVNTAFTVTALQTGYALDGVAIEFRDTLSGDTATATFDPANKRLVVDIDATQTSTTSIVDAIVAEGTFTAALDTTNDPTNDGSGAPGSTGIVATTSGGAAERLLGDDVNPLETKGMFTSLLRLKNALTNFDLAEVARSVKMLDDDFERLNFVRAELGAREQSLERTTRRIESEEVELRAALSNEIDSDLVEVISELTARQANLEATLRLVGQTMQLTLVDFL